MKTRRLYALTREKTIDRLSMNTENAADTHRVEPPVMDQPPDRFRVYAELIRHLANAD